MHNFAMTLWSCIGERRQRKGWSPENGKPVLIGQYAGQSNTCTLYKVMRVFCCVRSTDMTKALLPIDIYSLINGNGFFNVPSSSSRKCFNQPRPVHVLPQAMPLQPWTGQNKAGHWLGLPLTKAKIIDISQQSTLPGLIRTMSSTGRPIISSCFRAYFPTPFIQYSFLY